MLWAPVILISVIDILLSILYPPSGFPLWGITSIAGLALVVYSISYIAPRIDHTGDPKKEFTNNLPAITNLVILTVWAVVGFLFLVPGYISDAVALMYWYASLRAVKAVAATTQKRLKDRYPFS